jgi:glycosyltransferase involved in cell wall biosynthesis
MSRLRILEVSKSTGGLGTYMRWLANGLDRERFDLTFACLSEGSHDLADELARIPGVSALHWPMDRFRINLLGDALIVLRLAKLIRQRRFDIVHGHGSKAGFMIRLAAIGTRTKTAYSPHGFAFHEHQKPMLAGLYAFIERIAARLLTTRVITVSDGEQAEARQNGILTDGKFVTVHSGIDLKLFGNPVDKAALRAELNIPQEAFLIGTVGRLNDQKAPLDFVRVVEVIRRSHPNTYFLWIGDGVLLNDAQALSHDLGVEQALTFVGQRSDVPQLLSSMDCFLLTSHWEAFPLGLLEAMASYLPIVATALPGVQEALTDGEEGLIAPPGDISGLSAAVERLLCEPDFAAQLGNCARVRIEREFTRQIMMRNLMRVYDQMAMEVSV